ncbi:MAG: S41 family peptidase [Myxococcota bacterium]
MSLFALVGVAQAIPESESPFRNLGIFARVLAHIERSYVEEVDQDALIYGAIRGLMSTLDPHSLFMDPEEYRLLTSDTQGRFGGIGVEIHVQDGYLVVVGLVDDGPAQEAGMREGDRFLRIDGLGARDLQIAQAVRRVRGEPGSTVQVTIRREGHERDLEFNLTREVIKVEPIEASVIPDRVLYLKVKAFQEGSTEQLRQAIDVALASTSQDLSGVLLDLRNNPGGLLSEAISMSDVFLSSGTIVSTRGRDGIPIDTVTASQLDTAPPWPMVVLVNGYSASAAEIVAGALQDHGRAVLVGTRSFGKGSVQNIIELPGGSAMKLTVARYYTPSGQSIQAQGIEPDVRVEQFDTRELIDARRDVHPLIREESLEGHLDADASRRPELPARGQPRLVPESVPSEVFSSDFQARIAHQTLRGLQIHQQGRSDSSQ